MFTDDKLCNRSRFADIVLADGTIKALSIEAVKRLQGFPDWYQIPEDIAIAGTILGNSVPPLFAAQLFSGIPAAKPQKTIALICLDKADDEKKYLSHDWEYLGYCEQSEFDCSDIVTRMKWMTEQIRYIRANYPAGSRVVVFGDSDFKKGFDGLREYEIIDIKEIIPEVEVEVEVPELALVDTQSPELTLPNTQHPTTKTEGEKTYLLIDAIALDPETQSREQMNLQVLEGYKKARSQGAVFPPIVTFFDGTKYHLGDGWHRVFAEQLLGSLYISAEIRNGNKRDAMMYSCGVNATHGLQRNNLDKRKSVIIVLQDAEGVEWSNREIARWCGVDEKLVRKIRAELVGSGAVKPHDEVKFTRNGETKTQKIKPKEQLPREVVLSADSPIAPTTVAVVDAKLEDGNYLVNGEVIAPKFIVEKPIPSIVEEGKAIASDNGLKIVNGAVFPDMARNDGLQSEISFEKVAKNQAAINQLVDANDVITQPQMSQLLGLIKLERLSEKDLKALIKKIEVLCQKQSA
jgi:hypothetical protein